MRFDYSIFITEKASKFSSAISKKPLRKQLNSSINMSQYYMWDVLQDVFSKSTEQTHRAMADRPRLGRTEQN